MPGWLSCILAATQGPGFMYPVIRPDWRKAGMDSWYPRQRLYRLARSAELECKPRTHTQQCEKCLMAQSC